MRNIRNTVLKTKQSLLPWDIKNVKYNFSLATKQHSILFSNTQKVNYAFKQIIIYWDIVSGVPTICKTGLCACMCIHCVYIFST